MSRWIGMAVVVAGLAGCAFAAPQGLYVSGQGGVSYMPDLQMRDGIVRASDSFKTGSIFGTAIGYDSGNRWRYELDWTHQAADIDHFNGISDRGHLWSMGVMTNVLYDLTEGTALTPYVGGGLGVQWIGSSVHGFSGRAWRPAYQLRTGVRYDLARQTALFVEYRFVQSQALTLADGPARADHDFRDHALMVGIAFHPDVDMLEPYGRVARYLGLASDDGNTI